MKIGLDNNNLNQLTTLVLVILISLFTPRVMADPCQQGDRQLPMSGLCTSQVKHLVPSPSNSYVEGLKLFGCKPVINDGLFVGQIVLYQAAQCKGKPAQLEGGVGAHAGSLDVWGGGFHAETLEDPVKVATLLEAPADNPTKNLMRWARYGMQEHYTKAEIQRCKPRKAPDEGKDAWVVGEYSLPNLPKEFDGPRDACGSYGYTEDSRAFWRITQGLAMYFDLGQDAASDVDPLSITFFHKTINGQLLKLQDVMAGEIEAATQVDSTSHIPNISGIKGVQEQFYAKTRGWNVYTGIQGSRALYCTATKTVNDLRLRFDANGRFWQVAVPVKSPASRNGQLEVDNKAWDMQWSGNALWTSGRFGTVQRNAIGQGNMMILDIGRASIDLPLSGTEAMFLKLQECVAKGGIH